MLKDVATVKGFSLNAKKRKFNDDWKSDPLFKWLRIDEEQKMFCVVRKRPLFESLGY